MRIYLFSKIRNFRTRLENYLYNLYYEKGFKTEFHFVEKYRNQSLKKVIKVSEMSRQVKRNLFLV